MPSYFPRWTSGAGRTSVVSSSIAAFECTFFAAGQTFVDITGNLPDVPATSLALRGKQIIVGTDLSNLSVSDLEERVAALHAEIERVEAEMNTKKARAAAADAIFKRS